MKILVQFSGGKDSQACLIYAVEKYGANNVTGVFCDTGWEHEITYKHIQDVCSQLSVELVVIKSKEYDGFIDMAKKKKRFPSAINRFCSVELKTKPMTDYILDVIKESFITIQGIRAEESINRAKMQKECSYFKYYTQPAGVDKRGRNYYDNYRKAEVLEFIKHYAGDIIRPVFDWTGNQVMEYILSHDQKPNPLYYMGVSRVGCAPCVLSRLNETKLFMERFPEKMALIAKHEKEIGSTFFGIEYIPEKYGTKIVDGKRINTIEDIEKYLMRNSNQVTMFDEPEIPGGRSCMSIYNICE